MRKRQAAKKTGKIARLLGAKPAPTSDEAERTTRSWARFFFASATSFSHADHRLFQEAMLQTRPGLDFAALSLNRKQLAGRLLDEEYDEVREPLIDLIYKAATVCLLATAGIVTAERNSSLFRLW